MLSPAGWYDDVWEDGRMRARAIKYFEYVIAYSIKSHPVYAWQMLRAAIDNYGRMQRYASHF